MSAGAHLSKEFFDLVKTIGEAKSKQEEDRIVVAEVAKLKKMMGDAGIKGKLLKEYLLRIIYVEMLGHDASFGYMKAVEVRRVLIHVHTFPDHARRLSAQKSVHRCAE